MPQALNRLNRWLVWLHRWAGVALCLLFFLWFVSGAVLHFVGFPELGFAERVEHADVIDASRIRLTPAAAMDRMPHAVQLRLIGVEGRPVYVGTLDRGGAVAVSADTGTQLGSVTETAARAIAERFDGSPAISVDGPVDYDQWIVAQRFDPYRPFFRVALADDDRTVLYVSYRTGEVLQRTRFRERFWNWAGAVIHWIYFTPLRSHWSAWDETVWYVSLMALLSSAIGTWLGIVRFAANRSAGRKGLSPFRGWLRWHHVIGLFASIIVIGWIGSGWLSMDHGRLFSVSTPTTQEVAAMRGVSLQRSVRSLSLATLAAVLPATVVQFNAISGAAAVTAYGPKNHLPRVIIATAAGNSLDASIPVPSLVSAVHLVWGGTVDVISPRSPYDALYRRSEDVDSSAIGLEAGIDHQLRIYLDPYTAQILAVMDPSRRLYAWLYYALHTLRFPGLIGHAFVRTSIELTLLAVGMMFSATGVVLAWRRVRRDWRDGRLRAAETR